MGKVTKRAVPNGAAQKMPLRNAEGAKDSASGTASAITRQLALGGIALVWLIKVGKPEAGGINWNEILLISLLMFAAALVLDLLQYVWGAVFWSWFFADCEQKGKGLENLVSAPLWINQGTAVFFFFKILFVLAAYGIIIFYIFGALNRP